MEKGLNLSFYIFGSLIGLGAMLFLLGRIFSRSRLRCFGSILVVGSLLAWAGLYVGRPAWLRIAGQQTVPIPDARPLCWTIRADGMETAELELKVGKETVDRMVLVKLDPQRYRFEVRWDPKGSRTAEDWQRETGAAVVVNGSYFDHNFVPLTPIKIDGTTIGPANYVSAHGALVLNGSSVDIVDLNGKNLAESTGRYSTMLVSYPILVDSSAESRVHEKKAWLASRNFVALDPDGNVLLGTTETGFFTLYRLGEFLRKGPLKVKIALNLDGGPLVSQVIKTGTFSREFHGKAELTNSNDVLRAFWHEHFRSNWTMPIVLVAFPVGK